MYRPFVEQGVKINKNDSITDRKMIQVKVYFRQHSNAEDGFVWISFYVHREKVNFSTKVKCLERDFDKKRFRIKATDPQATDKNLIIDSILSRINNVFVKFRLRDKKLTRNLFLKNYNRPSDYATFYDFIKDYRKKHSLLEGTTEQVHDTVINKLKNFSEELEFDEITPEWLDLYYAYLRKTLKNNENTAYKNMSTLRKYVKAAWKAGYIEEYPFEDWHIKRTKSNYNYLTEDELNLLIAMYRDGSIEEKYYKALEFFLFLCFSSLHIGDAKSLKLEQFNNESFTYFRIKNRNRKPEPVVVPVSSALRQLLSNITGYRKKGLIFEHLPADQTMNRYLKEIAKMAEINKPITHKTGRHTFATYFLRKTKDLTALKEILGHSELRETLIYAHVLDEAKQEGITCFNSFEI
jgi:site-specific recombinase XerD